MPHLNPVAPCLVWLDYTWRKLQCLMFLITKTRTSPITVSLSDPNIVSAVFENILSLIWKKHSFTSTQIIFSYNYTECHRRNGPNFGRVFLMLNYTDITQNTYIQSWTVTEKSVDILHFRVVYVYSCLAHWPWERNALRISLSAQAPPNAIR